MPNISHVKLPSNTEYDLKGSLVTVVGTQTTDTASWTGSCILAGLTSGTTIAYYLPRGSSNNVTLTLTMRTGTDTPAVPVYFQGNTRLGTQYPAGSLLVLAYYAAGDIKVNGTATSDNRWVVVSYVNSEGTDTKVTQADSSADTTYDVLLSGSATGSGTQTETANKSDSLTFNPDSATLTATNISATTINGVTVGNNPEFTDTTYANGSGITIGSGNAINHSNSVTAQPTQAIYPIAYDAQGHITGAGTAFTPGAAATKGVDTSISQSSTNDNLPTSKAVYDYVAGLPQAMEFKGTVGDDSSATILWSNLPTPAASNKGWTYKAISAHSTDPVCKAGDVIISNGSVWVIIPSGDEPAGTVTSVALDSGNTGITVSGGPITSSGTLTVSHADTSSAASITGQSGKFVNAITLDDFGHVTAATTADVVTTDENVKQTAATDNKDYRLLLSANANDTQETAGVNKNTDLKYNPSTKNLMVTKINGVAVGSSPKFTDNDTVTTVAFSKSNGAGTFSQTVDGTSTNIFTTSDSSIGSASGWSAGDFPVTFGIDQTDSEMLVISNGSKPALTVTSTNVVSAINVVNS